jgi:predicted hydrocarbon binding protein
MFMVLYSAAPGRRPASERPRRGGVVCVTPRDYLCHAMNATVDALIPLSFLEAVRSVDSPDGDLEAEFVAELRTKRFGLSDTVYAQIRRYGDMVKRGVRPAQEEAVALATLIGRRPDAEAAFRAAGRYVARETYARIPVITRQAIAVLPSLLSRPMALAQTRKIAERYWGGVVRRSGAHLILEVESSVTVDSAPNSLGCTYYEESLHELLRLLGATSGRVDHVRCAARNEGRCEWRVDWRNLSAA